MQGSTITIDLAGLLREEQAPLGRALIDAYEAATGLAIADRAHQFAELKTFWLIEAALIHPGEPGYVPLEECLEMLRRGPILS